MKSIFEKKSGFTSSNISKSRKNSHADFCEIRQHSFFGETHALIDFTAPSQFSHVSWVHKTKIKGSKEIFQAIFFSSKYSTVQ